MHAIDAPHSGTLLEIRGLEKSFRSQNVLKGINLTVNNDEVAVLLGSSGSGKTTLLRCLNFLERRRRKKPWNAQKKVMDQVGLGAKFDTRPYRLSGGQQQRAGIARALP